MRRIIETVAGLAVDAMVVPHLAVALGPSGALRIAPAAAAVCGHLLGGWLAARGIGVTCDSLRGYLEDHR